MPKPKPNESKSDWMGRCVPMMVAEGKDKDQAVAACGRMFMAAQKKPTGSIILAESTPGQLLAPPTDGVSRYIKRVLRAGHTVTADDGTEIEITDKMLATMAASTNAFIAGGGKVPAPASADPHANADNAEANKGWWSNFVVQDGSLWATLALSGDDADQLAAVTDVSIGAVEKYTDSKGESYKWPVLHVALTPTPAVTDLGEFHKLAASRVFRASRTPDQEQPMERLKAIALSLGVKVDGLDEAALNAAIDEKIAANTAALKASAETAKQLAASQEQVKTLEASRGAKVDPDLLEEMAETAEAGLDSLVKSGNQTPAVVADLKSILVGGPAERKQLTLSRSAGVAAGFGGSLVKAITAALAKNDPKVLGEQTKGQQFALSRNVPGENQPKFDPKQVESRLDAIGIPKARS